MFDGHGGPLLAGNRPHRASASGLLLTLYGHPGIPRGAGEVAYPTLLAAIGDVAHPSWRDLGYAAGALIAGVAADRFGLAGAMSLVTGLALLSGVGVAIRMHDRPAGPSLREGDLPAEELAGLGEPK